MPKLIATTYITNNKVTVKTGDDFDARALGLSADDTKALIAAGHVRDLEAEAEAAEKAAEKAAEAPRAK